jgi:hypothetical protein
MHYRIPWDRLRDIELDFLERTGVEMHPRGMAFSREPSWEDFSLAFAYIYAIKARSKPDEEEVNWAIGDCINQRYRYFSQEVVDEWLDEFFHLTRLRDIILNAAGGTLILLQQVEDAVKLCVAALNIDGAGLTIESLFSDDPARRRKTLGQLANALKHTDVFIEEFHQRFARFVQDRNTFAHSLWIEVPRKYPRSGGLPAREEFEEILHFIQHLIADAVYFDRIFRGFRYELTSDSLRASNRQDAENLPMQQWGKYIADFHEVLNTSSDPNEDEGAP